MDARRAAPARRAPPDGAAAGAAGDAGHRPAGDHPPLLHARRHRRRHRLHARGALRARARRARRLAHQRGADRGIGRSAGRSSRWRSSATSDDNCIIVCSIENVDPMGVHTGDSITVAPALTLTDKEYQVMRDASIAVLREIGVETGGSNVQFAVNPAGRADGGDRDEPARLALLRARLEGHRLSDRQGRGAARRRLHARRARERHHRRRDAGRLRADHRLRRHQDPALRLREISRRRAGADHVDEVGRRGDGDRPHLRGIAAEGAARAGDRALRPRRGRDSRASALATTRTPCAPRSAVPRPDRLLTDRAGAAARLRRRADPRILPHRPAGSCARSSASSTGRRASASTACRRARSSFGS